MYVFQTQPQVIQGASHDANSTLGTATNETATVGGEVCTLTRELDDYHRLASLRVGDAQAHFGYDVENRLATVSNAVFTVAYAYTTDGWDAGYAVTLTNGVVLSRALTRDTYRRSLIGTITNSVDGVAVNPLAYNYDVLNRATARNADTFGYNARNEVTAATILSNAYTYVYDFIGSHATSTLNSATTTYTANALNQYASILCAPAPLREPSYDLDGNLLTNGVWSYAWNAENRLVAAYSNGVCVVSNAYDHASRRVLKITPTATHAFGYDGWNLVQETVSTASGVTTNAYVWGKDLSGTMQGAGGVGGLLAASRNGTCYFPFYDANGNITAYVDETGSVVASYAYDAFGATIAQSGALADSFAHRFSTKYYDAEAGLYYYGYRFYSPALHRWLNRDPIEEDGGLNLYAFCKNSPHNLFDILGREPDKADDDSNAESDSKYVSVPVDFRVWSFTRPDLDLSRDLAGGVMLVCMGNGKMRIAMYPNIGFPPEATPNPKIKVNYNITPPQHYAQTLTPRVSGCPQPNQTGLSPRELFGMPTSASSGNYIAAPKKIGRYIYGNARFKLHRSITKNGELQLESSRENMFRDWLINSSIYPQTADIYVDVDVAIGDIIEVKMGNGNGSSSSHGFWTKYKIGSKPGR